MLVISGALLRRFFVRYAGLANGTIFALKVWEPDYLSCKVAVAKSNHNIEVRDGFAPLYLQYSDIKYYEAMNGKWSGWWRDVGAGVGLSE